MGNCSFNSFMADKYVISSGYNRIFSPEDIHMYNDYCIANHRSTIYQVRKSGIYPEQSTYLTIPIGWRRRERACQIPQEKKREMRYVHHDIYSKNAIPKQGKPRCCQRTYNLSANSTTAKLLYLNPNSWSQIKFVSFIHIHHPRSNHPASQSRNKKKEEPSCICNNLNT